MKKAGFEKEVRLVENSVCPACCKPIDMLNFKDDLSCKEFSISGLCQKCQDEIFGV